MCFRLIFSLYAFFLMFIFAEVSFADPLSGKIFYDVNGDGFPAYTDPGINNLTVHAKNTVTTILNSTLTDSAGFFSFDLPSGTYSLFVDTQSVQGVAISTPSLPLNINVPSSQASTIRIGYYGGSSVCPSLNLDGKQYSYFPSTEINDGKFVSISGTKIESLSKHSLTFQLVAPSNATSLEIGVFDGDTGGTNSGSPHWDEGNDPLEFTLTADPTGNGTGTNVVYSVNGSQMADNDWFSLTIPTTVTARSPSGNYFYRLNVTLSNVNGTSESNFKLRTSGAIFFKNSPFSIIGASKSQNDLGIIYPNYPLLLPTRYTGNWNFAFFVPGLPTSVEIWDGDFDYGSSYSTFLDTDDQNTPNSIPAFALGTGAVLEGVSIGTGVGKGNPEDDNSNITHRRSPNPEYTLTDPKGSHYLNSNLSGNSEWEVFRVGTTPFDPYNLDIKAQSLSSGIYGIDFRGLDLSNKATLKSDYLLLGVCKAGFLPPAFPYIIGDLVWKDINRDGTYDLNEPKIPSVILYLKDSLGNILDKTKTDSNGFYKFNVPPFTYTVEVAPENFTNGPLTGFASTIGGNSLTRTVINQNVLSYNFGYSTAPAPITLPPVDCLGIPNGKAVRDRCGVCNGDGKSCLSCKNIEIANKQLIINKLLVKERELLERAISKIISVTGSVDPIILTIRSKSELLLQSSLVTLWSYPTIRECTSSKFCSVSSLQDKASSLGMASSTFVTFSDELVHYIRRFSNNRIGKKVKKSIVNTQRKLRSIHLRTLRRIEKLPKSTYRCE